MRRSDHDVTNTIQTTDLQQVAGETLRVYRDLYQGTPSGVGGTPAAAIERAFEDLGRLYAGEHPDYLPCDTSYHDIQHVLDVTLAMVRLMDGYERSREVTRSHVGDAPAMPAACFALGVVTALFHDFGYLRRRRDRRHRYGAEYTLTHVTRGSKHLHRYLPRIGLRRYAAAGAALVHYTGYERRAETIPLNGTLLRRIGHMLGTADIIAQMADRCYLEKCRDRLYPEFVEGGLAARDEADRRSSVMFRSVEDLMGKTPRFYKTATTRLNDQLGSAHGYAGKHFGGQNLYFDEIDKNMQYASAVALQGDLSLLRREPPTPGEELLEIF
jgi:hypothetical protein